MKDYAQKIRQAFIRGKNPKNDRAEALWIRLRIRAYLARLARRQAWRNVFSINDALY